MIIRQKFERLSSVESPRRAIQDTGWADVAGLLSKVSTCRESMSVLRTEGVPYRMRGGMRDIGFSTVNWSGVFSGVQDEPLDDLVHEDSGADSESIGEVRRGTVVAIIADDDESPSSEDGAVPAVENSMVSVTVGLPRRFGHPVCADEDAEADQETDAAPDLGMTSSESSVKSSLREILRKVTVNESVLRNAIESLGGGVKGLQAVVDYVKYFQEAGDSNAAAGTVNPDGFMRGLEQFCSLHNNQAPRPGGAQTHAVNNPTFPAITNDFELHCPGGADQSRQAVPNMQMRSGQEEWSRNGHAGDPYAMGYMESMSGYFPNFCYPYPPPFASYGPFNLGVRPMYMPVMQVPYFTPPSLEYVHKADSITKASRKSRIARRRGHAAEPHHARPAIKSGVHIGGGTVQSGNYESIAHQKVAVMQGLSTRDLMLILQKQLSPSGVSSLGRIVLPKKESETHLPHLVASEGVLLKMTDFDTAQTWTFRYRFWSNNKSRMYLLENTRDFVKAHNLRERDMLSLYRDAEGSYVVRGEKYGSNLAVDAANEKTAEEDAPADDNLPHKKQKF